MTTFLDISSAIFLLAGSALLLVSTFGLLRMPDVYARIHVATKPATLALLLTLSGAALRLGAMPDFAKITLVVLFQFWTIPAASHMLGRALRSQHVQPEQPLVVEDDVN